MWRQRLHLTATVKERGFRKKDLGKKRRTVRTLINKNRGIWNIQTLTSSLPNLGIEAHLTLGIKPTHINTHGKITPAILILNGATMHWSKPILCTEKNPLCSLLSSLIVLMSRCYKWSSINKWYSGWKKSCTTLDGWNPMNNGINHLSTGAGFLPSTVCPPLFGPANARTWRCYSSSSEPKSCAWQHVGVAR